MANAQGCEPDQSIFTQKTDYRSLASNSQLLVFTDLDGTLLDHETYSYDAAKPAILHLFGKNIPLILNTSKTLSETTDIQDAFGGFHPFIVENGAAIVIPENYFDTAPTHDRIVIDSQDRSYFVKQLGKSYKTIRYHLNQLREAWGFKFCGFGDMSDGEVAQLTGLSIAEANKSRQRLASEPLLWQGTESEMHRFRQHLSVFDLNLIQGGRFWHVKSARDKADAMLWLKQLYQTQSPHKHFATVALGDSPNDQSMLEQADIAVVIATRHGHRIELTSAANQYYTHQTGPRGWEQAIHHILQDYLF